MPYVAGVILLGKGSKHLPILCEDLGIPCAAHYTGEFLKLIENADGKALIREGRKEYRQEEILLHKGDEITVQGKRMLMGDDQECVVSEVYLKGLKLKLPEIIEVMITVTNM